ncbi:MAG: SAM-dependent DNA methyltransferase [Candidatus Heimdallarchaeota archaeon]|nr:SAM-dependent DNA methyltransferase [Candidatus Heimdallarchaeota archaeon]MCK4609908.1 SAM-dependent DNA methyltransferase [Candidatus Heimdallarchaeota archaeon]
MTFEISYYLLVVLLSKRNNNKKGVLGFEDKLWQAADKLRGKLDPSDYKYIVLGLIFLKYISDSFENKRVEINKELKDDNYSDEEIQKELEDRDYFTASNVFWVPKEARWLSLQESSKKPEIGVLVDNAMEEIEKKNPSLKGVLPRIYAGSSLDKRILGEVFDLIGDIGLGDKENESQDILGRVYEYFLGKFAQKEGKLGGEFFTPSSIVRLLVEMIEPYKGRVYDPCCGSGGMFVQSEKFVKSHGGKAGDISIYGQESNPTTWKLARMNLAIRGIEANLGSVPADTFHNDLHKTLKADFILANPPFNDSDWGAQLLQEDVRWRYNIVPPNNNSNFAWVQHFIHHLKPNGITGFVLANGSLSSQTSGEGEIRKSIVEEDLVDCIISLPSQLFLTTQIPACLWFLTRTKNDGKTRDRRGEILFIDAREYGQMIDRKTRELTEEDIKEISSIYHEWKKRDGNYEDEKGLSKSAKLEEMKEHNYVLTPGRYVGFKDITMDEEEFKDKFGRLSMQLKKQMEEGRKLDKKIEKILELLENENS